jgi:hypothetical protein
VAMPARMSLVPEFLRILPPVSAERARPKKMNARALARTLFSIGAPERSGSVLDRANYGLTAPNLVWIFCALSRCACTIGCAFAIIALRDVS